MICLWVFWVLNVSFLFFSLRIFSFKEAEAYVLGFRLMSLVMVQEPKFIPKEVFFSVCCIWKAALNAISLYGLEGFYCFLICWPFLRPLNLSIQISEIFLFPLSSILILLLIFYFRMEFAYRTWVREKREGLSPDDLDELRREVQTTLGTAKWQVGY